MRAATQERYGPPEVVRVVEVAEPVPAEDELLVRVHATTVNRTDCAYRAAHPWFIRAFTGLRRPKVATLGCEFAGEVEVVGSAVTRFAVGDRVFGYLEPRFGGHADHLVVAETASIATIPARMSFAEAAPGTEGSHYALAFIRRAKIRAGHDVLVHGATGAIGSAAVQLLEHLGATVTATCPSEHTDLVRGLGARRVIDLDAGDFTDDDHAYDFVFDAVGKSSYFRCRKLLKPDGTYLSSDLGPLSQNVVLPLLTRVLPGRNVVFPLPSHNHEIVEHLRDLMESGDFEPLVDRHYPLEEIVEAYRYVETGQKVGNVVITVAPGEHRPD